MRGGHGRRRRGRLLRSAFRVRQVRREIYLPWPGFNGVSEGIVIHGATRAQAEGLARALHPAVAKSEVGTRKAEQLSNLALSSPIQTRIIEVLDGGKW